MGYPSTFSGVGTVSEAGRWSTSSVRKYFSVVYCRILAVYPSSFFCAGGTAQTLRAKSRHTAVLRMIPPSYRMWGGRLTPKEIGWQAKAPAPQEHKLLRTKVGQTLSSV